jgi:hypothetical protein
MIDEQKSKQIKAAEKRLVALAYRLLDRAMNRGGSAITGSARMELACEFCDELNGVGIGATINPANESTYLYLGERKFRISDHDASENAELDFELRTDRSIDSIRSEVRRVWREIVTEML